MSRAMRVCLNRVVAVVAWSLLVPILATAQTVEYYGTDAIGSVRVVFDAAGNVVGRMDYGPFGEQVSVSTVVQKSYAGLFRDGEAGLDYAEARSYQVRTGRFNAPDPVYGGLFSTQRWNRYSYALNNPLSVVDPNGLDPCPVDFCTGTDEEDPGGGGLPPRTPPKPGRLYSFPEFHGLRWRAASESTDADADADTDAKSESWTGTATATAAAANTTEATGASTYSRKMYGTCAGVPTREPASGAAPVLCHRQRVRGDSEKPTVDSLSRRRRRCVSSDREC